MYASKYKIPFREFSSGELWETYIQEKEYSGSETELIGTAKPTVFEYRPENDNDYDFIRPSICTIGMNSLTNHQFIEFFTSDDRRYKILVYRDSVFMWGGWILPDAYKEPYISPSYEVYITATDGLLSLKDKDWKPTNDSESDYEGKKTLIKGIEGCLNKLGLDEVDLWDAAYLYEANHDTAGSPLSQTSFNCERFYDDDDNPLDCYTVLLELLKVQNLQIWQEQGCWNLVPQNARKSTYRRFKYLWSGSTGYWRLYYQLGSGSENHDPSITVDNSNYVFYATPELSFRPAWKKFTVKQDYGYNNNLLRNVDFNKYGNWNAAVGTDRFIYLTYSESLNINNYLEWNLGSVLVNATENEFLNVEVKFYGPDDLAIEVMVLLDGTTDYTLSSAAASEIATWKTGTHYIYTMTLSGKASMTDDAEFIGFLPKKSNKIPINGTLKLRIFQPHKLSGSTEVDGTIGFYIKDIKVYLSRNDPMIEDTEVVTNINENNTYVPETLEMMLGDLPYPMTRKEYWQPPIEIGYTGYTILFPRTITTTFDNQSLVYDGGLYYKIGETYYPTTLWTVKDRNQYNKLRNVIADEISLNHLDPQWIISGQMYGHFGYGAILTVVDKKYMILRGSYSPYDKEWDLELFEIGDTEQGFLKLRAGGYVKLRGGGKIKVK